VARITRDLDGRASIAPTRRHSTARLDLQRRPRHARGAGQVSVRAAARLTHTATRAYTPARLFCRSTSAPSVGLDPSVEAFLADGLIGPAEMLWRGSVQDDHVASGAGASATKVGDPASCTLSRCCPATRRKRREHRADYAAGGAIGTSATIGALRRRRGRQSRQHATDAQLPSRTLPPIIAGYAQLARRAVVTTGPMALPALPGAVRDQHMSDTQPPAR